MSCWEWLLVLLIAPTLIVILEDEPKPEPKWADLFGADPDFTDGKPTNEWLDEQRGDA